MSMWFPTIYKLPTSLAKCGPKSKFGKFFNKIPAGIKYIVAEHLKFKNYLEDWPY